MNARLNYNCLAQDAKNKLHAANVVKDLCLLTAMHNCGYGNKRILEIRDELLEVYRWTNIDAKATDEGKDKFSNLATTAVKLARDLSKAGIDYKEILNIEQFVINGVDVFKTAERCL